MPISNTPITKSTSLTDLISYAKKEVQNLFPGEEFLVKDLFLGYEWNRLIYADRSRIGSEFHTYAKGEGAPLIDYIGKTPQNQHRYRKK